VALSLAYSAVSEKDCDAAVGIGRDTPPGGLPITKQDKTRQWSVSSSLDSGQRFLVMMRPFVKIFLSVLAISV